MIISELISLLEQIKTEHGDLRLTTHEIGGLGVKEYNGPRLKEIREKRPREYKTYYVDYGDGKPIEKVLHI